MLWDGVMKSSDTNSTAANSMTSTAALSCLRMKSKPCTTITSSSLSAKKASKPPLPAPDKKMQDKKMPRRKNHFPRTPLGAKTTFPQALCQNTMATRKITCGAYKNRRSQDAQKFVVIGRINFVVSGMGFSPYATGTKTIGL